MNDLYLTDEDVHALDEPTWEEQEIERLKEENSKLRIKIEELKKELEYMNSGILL